MNINLHTPKNVTYSVLRTALNGLFILIISLVIMTLTAQDWLQFMISCVLLNIWIESVEIVKISC